MKSKYQCEWDNVWITLIEVRMNIFAKMLVSLQHLRLSCNVLHCNIGYFLYITCGAAKNELDCYSKYALVKYGNRFYVALCSQ